MTAADALDVHITIEPPVVDRDTAAQLLGGISIDKLGDLIRSGELAAKTIGKRVVIDVNEIRRFARECPAWEPRRSA